MIGVIFCEEDTGRGLEGWLVVVVHEEDTGRGLEAWLGDKVL